MWLGKDIENRTWKPPKTILGERIAIHAGKKVDPQAVHTLWNLGEEGLLPAGWQGRLARSITARYRGVILGTVEVAGWVHEDGSSSSPGLASGSRWMVGPYGWVLADPEPLAAPEPAVGSQGIWFAPPSLFP